MASKFNLGITKNKDNDADATESHDEMAITFLRIVPAV